MYANYSLKIREQKSAHAHFQKLQNYIYKTFSANRKSSSHFVFPHARINKHFVEQWINCD